MAIYTVHEPPRLTGDAAADADRFIFVRDGFYGWAFLLAPLWMLWHRLWLVLLGYLVLFGVLETALRLLGTPSSAQVFAGLLVAVLVGTEAGTLRRFTLARRRHRAVGVVVAVDLEAAERRFFSTWDVELGAPKAQAQAAPRRPRVPAASASDIIGLFPEPGALR